jgi:thiaminase/transcriptional activator TenA
MTFSQDVWQRNHDLYQKILALPFNQELAKELWIVKLFVIM